MILGVDVWSGYGRLDWAAIRDHGIRFAWIRATGAVGAGGLDSECAANVAGARAAEVPAGPYHVFHHGQDAAKSAEHCFAAADGLGSVAGDMPPVLDAEIPGISTFTRATLSGARETIPEVAGRMVASLERHVEAFHARFGRLPLVYGYTPWFEALGVALAQSKTLAACGLWIAAYPRLGPWAPTEKDLEKLPRVVAPWSRPLIWQYSAEHSVPVPGVRSMLCPQKDSTGKLVHAKGSCQLVDRNVWLGDEDGLLRLRGLDPSPMPGILHGKHVVEASLAGREPAA
jgi:GH25 family lysozyme M1 (1,4-beta-N-acetylmuramidase)